MFIASNPAVQMLKLSHHFEAAATDEQRSQAIAAGQAVLANCEGSAFQVGYVVGQVFGISSQSSSEDHFIRTARPDVLIIGIVVGLRYYLSKLGLAVSAFSGMAFSHFSSQSSLPYWRHRMPCGV
jgi:hypothetical protein